MFSFIVEFPNSQIVIKHFCKVEMKEKSQALLLLSSSTNQSVIFFYKSLLFEIISVKNIVKNSEETSLSKQQISTRGSIT